MRPLFVAGTDTGVGKTFVSACLLRLLGGYYWKPFQTGDDDDSKMVHNLSNCDAGQIFSPFSRLKAPLAPLHASQLQGSVINIDNLYPPDARPLIIEGAGGVMVPITKNVLTIDLMQKWNVRTILVARSTLGTINHTLLTLAALDARFIERCGVIMIGDDAPHNASAINDFSGIPVLATIKMDCGAVSPESVNNALPLLTKILEL